MTPWQALWLLYPQNVSNDGGVPVRGGKARGGAGNIGRRGKGRIGHRGEDKGWKEGGRRQERRGRVEEKNKDGGGKREWGQ